MRITKQFRGLSPGVCRISGSATIEARSATGRPVRPGPPGTWVAGPGIRSPGVERYKRGGCERYPAPAIANVEGVRYKWAHIGRENPRH
jgi:hypothetical protein